MKSSMIKLMKKSNSTKSDVIIVSNKHLTGDSSLVRSITSDESPTKKDLLKNMRSKMFGN